MAKHIIKNDKVRRVSVDLAVGAAFAAICLFVSFAFFDSPKEKMLKHEIEEYRDNFEILSSRVDELGDVIGDIEDKDHNVYRVLFETQPETDRIMEGGKGGNDVSTQFDGLTYKALLTDITKKIDELSVRSYAQSCSLDELYNMAVNREEMLACIPAVIPVREIDVKYISSYFGYRSDPIYGIRKFHKGIDFSASIGTDVIATGDGVVTDVHKVSMGGYGKYVEINHGFSYSTLYAHMNSIYVVKGQKVKRGQIIGSVGNTGKSSGPHLHYEVHKDGEAINPINYFYNDITPTEYEEMIELASQPGQTMD